MTTYLARRNEAETDETSFLIPAEFRAQFAGCFRFFDAPAGAPEVTAPTPLAEAMRAADEAREDAIDVAASDRAVAEAAERGEHPVPWDQAKRELGLEMEAAPRRRRR